MIFEAALMLWAYRSLDKDTPLGATAAICIQIGAIAYYVGFIGMVIIIVRTAPGVPLPPSATFMFAVGCAGIVFWLGAVLGRGIHWLLEQRSPGGF